jgi:hypothetical protein
MLEIALVSDTEANGQAGRSPLVAMIPVEGGHKTSCR